MLDGQCSSWKIILSGVLQGSASELLQFLIYISYLPHGFVSIYKIFADNTSIFSKVFDEDKSRKDLNNYLSIISE